jgi:hypothetical protein
MIWPKREKPIISTSAPPSRPAKSSSISSLRSGLRKRLPISTETGVSAIDSVTTATRSEAVASGKIEADAAAEKSTKPNSPPCGSRKAVRTALSCSEPKRRVSA